MIQDELTEAVRPQDELYEMVKRQILTLKMKPGEMLSENMLAFRFQAGRPAIRDVLSQLAEEGYVVGVSPAGNGCFHD